MLVGEGVVAFVISRTFGFRVGTIQDEGFDFVAFDGDLVDHRQDVIQELGRHFHHRVVFGDADLSDIPAGDPTGFSDGTDQVSRSDAVLFPDIQLDPRHMNALGAFLFNGGFDFLEEVFTDHLVEEGLGHGDGIHALIDQGFGESFDLVGNGSDFQGLLDVLAEVIEAYGLDLSQRRSGLTIDGGFGEFL